MTIGSSGGAPPPSGAGCAECEVEGGWWFHLRRCVDCGHIGCCDSSPSQHARAHASQTGHAQICSFEPGEAWCWSFESEDYTDQVPELTPPMHHPLRQSTPGPADRVPPDWEQHLR